MQVIAERLAVNSLGWKVTVIGFSEMRTIIDVSREFIRRETMLSEFEKNSDLDESSKRIVGVVKTIADWVDNGRADPSIEQEIGPLLLKAMGSPDGADVIDDGMCMLKLRLSAS